MQQYLKHLPNFLKTTVTLKTFKDGPSLTRNHKTFKTASTIYYQSITMILFRLPYQ